MSGHGHGAHGGEENKKVALLISVLALMLAVAEILGQSAQTKTLQSNIEASNLWAFFQAKTIRKTVAETAATIRRFRDAGVQRMYLQVLDLSDLEHLNLIAREVVPNC